MPVTDKREAVAEAASQKTNLPASPVFTGISSQPTRKRPIDAGLRPTTGTELRQPTHSTRHTPALNPA